MRARISTTVVAGVAASMLAAAPAVAQDRGEARDNGRSQSSDDRGRDRADQQRGSAFTVTTTADTVDAEPGDGRCEDAKVGLEPAPCPWLRHQGEVGQGHPVGAGQGPR